MKPSSGATAVFPAYSASIPASTTATICSSEPSPVPAPAHAHPWSPTSFLLYPAMQQPSYAYLSNVDSPSLSSASACAAAIASAAPLPPSAASAAAAAESVAAPHSVEAPAYAHALAQVRAEGPAAAEERVLRLRRRLAKVALSASASASVPAPASAPAPAPGTEATAASPAVTAAVTAPATQGPLRLLLQAGDCAERFSDCACPTTLRRKMRLLRRMALVLRARAAPALPTVTSDSGGGGGGASGVKVVIVGRIAGQFAKPRSCPVEPVPAPTPAPASTPAPTPAPAAAPAHADADASLSKLARGADSSSSDGEDSDGDDVEDAEAEAEAGCYGCLSPTAPILSSPSYRASTTTTTASSIPTASAAAASATVTTATAAASDFLPVFRGESVNGFAPCPRARAHDPQRLVQAHSLAAQAGAVVRANRESHGLLPPPQVLPLLQEGVALSEVGEWRWNTSGRDVMARVTALAAQEQETKTRARARAIGDVCSSSADGGLGGKGETDGSGSESESDEDEVFTSHEGLVLGYEAACIQPSTTPSTDAACGGEACGTLEGPPCLSADMIWIGERTRSPSQAHIELFRGVSNSLGVKLGPRVSPSELAAVLAALDPAREPGRVTVITRLGAGRAATAIPPLVAAVRAGGHCVVWACDPMHGNTRATADGVKTRDYDNIVAELRETAQALHAAGARLGGVHLEVSADRIAECVGGPGGAKERGLRKRYTSQCDPRLNEPQALQVMWELGDTLRGLYGGGEASV